MSLKILQANCATSTFTKRLDIIFDEATGFIVDLKDAARKASEVDYYFNDDCLLFAGMGDIHIHAREDMTGKNNYKEDFHSTCCAALNGGVIHVADMPNNPVSPVDDKTYLEKFNLQKNKTEIPILMYAGIGPQTAPLSFKVPYKVYMGPSIGELYFKNNQELDQVLVHYKNQFVSFHCEDPEILENSKNEKTHWERRPLRAELMATELAIHLIEKYQLKGKLCHYSAGEGMQAIVAAKKRGLDISCEVTPQHLYYSIEKLAKKSTHEQTFFQMNPPIRFEEDRKKLLEGIKDGSIDYLATDHAPHSLAEKEKGMSGLPGLDTYASFITWLILTEGVSPQTIARIASEGPGDFFNEFLFSLNEKTDLFKKWGMGFGYLEPGYSASFTILNLKKPITLTHSHLKTKALWSPFLGETFPGSLEKVFLHGKPK